MKADENLTDLEKRLDWIESHAALHSDTESNYVLYDVVRVLSEIALQLERIADLHEYELGLSEEDQEGLEHEDEEETAEAPGEDGHK